MCAVDFAGCRFELLGGRALWWPARSAVVCSDLHLGKDAAFRAAGLPVPPGSDASTLGRLDAIISRMRAGELIVLGDLFHAKAGMQELDENGAGRFFRSLKINKLLVPGNHDQFAGDLPRHWGFQVLEDGCTLGGLVLRHAPGGAGPWIAGHVHPSIRIPTGARGTLTLPAFVVGCDGILLPAFGEFTGNALVKARQGERTFVCMGPDSMAREVVPGRRPKTR